MNRFPTMSKTLILKPLLPNLPPARMPRTAIFGTGAIRIMSTTLRSRPGGVSLGLDLGG
jgi:hypothetical protein